MIFFQMTLSSILLFHGSIGLMDNEMLGLIDVLLYIGVEMDLIVDEEAERI